MYRETDRNIIRPLSSVYGFTSLFNFRKTPTVTCHKYIFIFFRKNVTMDTASYFNQIVQLLGDGDINSAVALIQNPDVDVNYRDVTHDLQTLMMRICYMTLSITDLERVLAAIFEKSPDVNTQDSWGRTALMHACIANKPGYIEGLLEHDNTDVTVTDFDGNNALSYAVQNCDIYTMEDILNHQHGATLATKINAKGK